MIAAFTQEYLSNAKSVKATSFFFVQSVRENVTIFQVFKRRQSREDSRTTNTVRFSDGNFPPIFT